MIIGLLKGLIVGIIVSIPVGPLGLLCIPRTLARGRRAGLAVGLGGSASDTLYSALALFALSFISGFIEAHKGWVPELLESPLNHSIIRRAREKGLVEIHIVNLHDSGKDNYKHITHYGFGRHAGMVIKPDTL